MSLSMTDLISQNTLLRQQKDDMEKYMITMIILGIVLGWIIGILSKSKR